MPVYSVRVKNLSSDREDQQDVPITVELRSKPPVGSIIRSKKSDARFEVLSARRKRK